MTKRFVFLSVILVLISLSGTASAVCTDCETTARVTMSYGLGVNPSPEDFLNGWGESENAAFQECQNTDCNDPCWNLPFCPNSCPAGNPTGCSLVGHGMISDPELGFAVYSTYEGNCNCGCGDDPPMTFSLPSGTDKKPKKLHKDDVPVLDAGAFQKGAVRKYVSYNPPVVEKLVLKFGRMISAAVR